MAHAPTDHLPTTYLPKLSIDKACKGKVKHPTYKSAEIAQRRMEKKAPNIAIYQCPYCGKYHLGNTVK